MKPTAAPPIFPYPHKPIEMRGYANCNRAKQAVMKGWWPSFVPGYDVAGRRR